MGFSHSFDYNGLVFHATAHWSNYRGGVNNLCVVTIRDAKGLMTCHGTSEKDKDAAFKNAKQNLKRRLAKL